VIPQTLGALIAFLTLVAPGIVFELLRERRRAGRAESVFREAARVALGSLGFSLASALLLLGVQGLSAAIFGGGPFIDLAQLAGDPTYANRHLNVIVLTMVIELAVACGLALAVDLALAKRKQEITSVRQQTAWHEVFRGDRPKNAVPWVHVQLINGSSFYGYHRSHSASGGPDEREIVLEGQTITYVGTPFGGGETVEKRVIGDRWPRVVISSSQIAYLRVQYRDSHTEQLVPPRRRGTGQQAPATTEPASDEVPKPASSPAVHP
jgi:hypothetical protein